MFSLAVYAVASIAEKIYMINTFEQFRTENKRPIFPYMEGSRGIPRLIRTSTCKRR